MSPNHGHVHMYTYAKDWDSHLYIIYDGISKPTPNIYLWTLELIYKYGKGL